MTRRHPSAWLLLIAVLPPTIAAQNQVPGFRTRIDVVRTDVAVIDNKTGKPLAGLNDRDFTVSENGVRQAITSFVAETGEPLGAAVPSGDASATANAGARTFLFVLGSSRMEGTSDPYGGLARFIRQRLRPTDRAALLVWDRVTPFTKDFEALARLVERRKQIPLDVVTSAQVDGQNREDMSPKTRAAVLRWLLPEGEPQDFLRSVAPIVAGTPDAGEVLNVWDKLNFHIVASDRLKVAAGIELLRQQPGEKRLVLVSLYGLATPIDLRNFSQVRSTEDALSIGTRAADAGVILDLVNTIGTERGLAYANAIQGAQQTARETGGEFGSLRTVEQQLIRLDETSRHGYIVGYAPTNPAMDGKRREVTIAVNRKDVTLVYRRSYTARPELPPMDVRETLTRARIQSAAEAAADFEDVRLGATAKFLTGQGGLQVRVDITIDPERLGLVQQDGLRTGSIDIAVFVGDRRRETIGHVTNRITLSLDAAKYEQTIKTGIPYTVLVPVTGRPLNAKVVVYSFDSDRVGTLTAQVR